MTFQYIIQDGWKLLVCKNDEVNTGDPSWTLKRIKDNGEHKVLPGKKKIYLDAKCKNPKRYDEAEEPMDESISSSNSGQQDGEEAGPMTKE